MNSSWVSSGEASFSRSASFSAGGAASLMPSRFRNQSPRPIAATSYKGEAPTAGRLGRRGFWRYDPHQVGIADILRCRAPIFLVLRELHQRQLGNMGWRNHIVARALAALQRLLLRLLEGGPHGLDGLPEILRGTLDGLSVLLRSLDRLHQPAGLVGH